MKKLIPILSVLSLSLISFACGSSSSDESEKDAASSEWTNTKMYNLVQAECATSGCHDGASGQPPDLKNFSQAEMRDYTLAKTRVANNEMPVGGLSAANKQIFADFYK